MGSTRRKMESWYLRQKQLRPFGDPVLKRRVEITKHVSSRAEKGEKRVKGTIGKILYNAKNHRRKKR